MINIHRINSDIATKDRREMADRSILNNRIRNDELTIQRRTNADIRKVANKTVRKSRIRNDELTGIRRSKEDKTINNNRLRNDEITINRRESKDEYWDILPFFNK